MKKKRRHGCRSKLSGMFGDRSAWEGSLVSKWSEMNSGLKSLDFLQSAQNVILGKLLIWGKAATGARGGSKQQQQCRAEDGQDPSGTSKVAKQALPECHRGAPPRATVKG